MENSKDLFVKAFMEAESINNQSFNSENRIDLTFSDSFEKEMNKLIKRNNQIKFSTRRNIKKGLLAAVISIIVMLTGLISVSATRTPFIEFIKKILPQFNEISLSQESTPPIDSIETEYTLTDLPDGYELDTYQKNDYAAFTVWKNQKGEEISFQQNLLDFDFLTDSEHNYKELYFNGYEAYLNEYESNTTLIWTDGAYWFTLSVANEEKDRILDLSKNILEKN